MCGSGSVEAGGGGGGAGEETRFAVERVWVRGAAPGIDRCVKYDGKCVYNVKLARKATDCVLHLYAPTYTRLSWLYENDDDVYVFVALGVD